MISTARPLGQEVEVGRYELAATTANAGWASSAYTRYGYRDAHHSYQVLGPVHDLADM